MKKEAITKLLTDSWQDQLKKLPKYQRKELTKFFKLYKQLEYFKFSVISFNQLKLELRQIIKGGK